MQQCSMLFFQHMLSTLPAAVQCLGTLPTGAIAVQQLTGPDGLLQPQGDNCK